MFGLVYVKLSSNEYLNPRLSQRCYNSNWSEFVVALWQEQIHKPLDNTYSLIQNGQRTCLKKNVALNCFIKTEQ